MLHIVHVCFCCIILFHYNYNLTATVTLSIFQISTTVIPIHVRIEEHVKILSMGTNVSVSLVIQEQLAEQVK